MNRKQTKRPSATLKNFDDALLEEPSTKKPRFDPRNPSTLANPALEEKSDAILDLDEIGKGGLKSKRKAIRLEGYDSDSSEENFNSRADAKANADRKSQLGRHASEDETDDDMFAESRKVDMNEERSENSEPTKIKKKAVRFLDENEIEGQVTSSKSGGHVPADFSMGTKSTQNDTLQENGSSSDGSADDEERAKIDEEMDEELGAGSKKHHAPKLDAFNMRDEAKEGKFDENGNFVRNATDPFAVYDSWLEGSSKAEMKRAKEAQLKREAERRRAALEDDAISMGTILAALITRLDKGETALEALGRLNESKPKKKQSWQRNRRKDREAVSEDVDMIDSVESTHDIRRKNTIDKITTSADQLLTRGVGDVYELEREALIRRYQQETGEEWSHASDPEETGEHAIRLEWQFRWTDGRDNGRIHGPYDEQNMEVWAASGFFSDNVEFRQSVGGKWSVQAPFTKHIG